jgi:coenzyme PQQ precursor peptide PqqA
MNWNTPEIIEIALGAEINSYASADLELDESAPDSSSQGGSTADAWAISAASA